MGYFANAGQIIVNFVFVTLVALAVFRVLLQLVRANFYNPVCQALYKLTNPLLMPLHRLVPNWRTFDVAATLVAWLLTAIKLALLYAMYGQGLGLAGLAVMAVADLIELVIVLCIGLIFVRALMSFISVERTNPVVPLLFQLTEPLLRPVRKRLPTFGGFDFSPALVILALMLALALLVAPLLDLGQRLAQGAL
ncbi:YggT family protein [Dokdonella fugitiva]|jgi:YggT family protein|uniref:YggT family protein n=1 Tax=Dokdonella fugitiva TaxID=328517 RepID=A0A4R2I0Y8_9GAMM|nr:YggT family protein [Dokdonella fugitiva]TCO37306.1 YggT family protein [Dokdonella fugitiva]